MDDAEVMEEAECTMEKVEPKTENEECKENQTTNGQLNDEERLWQEVAMQDRVYKEMLQDNLDPPVILYLMKMFKAGKLCYDELDKRFKEGLTKFTPNQGVQFLKVMAQRNLEMVANKCTYLCGQMKIFKFYINKKESIFNGPDPKKIKALIDMTGYNIEVSIGQRKYGGPPPNWEGDAPSHRDISISCIPQDAYEDTLVPILSNFGRIWELRIMIDNITGFTRSFCFVKFCDYTENEAALDKIDGLEIEGRRVKANFSASNPRLFLGNIPKDLDAEAIKAVLKDYLPDLIECKVFVSEEMASKGLCNRGFCILDFGQHSKAAKAKKVLAGIGPKIFEGKQLAVEWTDKPYVPSEQEMRKVKACHISNLSSEVTEDILRQTFEAFGKIFHVQKVRDYAFVHFEEREGAVEACEKANGLELCGLKITCNLSQSGPLKRRLRRKAALRILRGDYGRQGQQEVETEEGREDSIQRPYRHRQQSYGTRDNKLSHGGYQGRNLGYDGGRDNNRDISHYGRGRDGRHRDGGYSSRDFGSGGYGDRGYRDGGYQKISYGDGGYEDRVYRGRTYRYGGYSGECYGGKSQFNRKRNNEGQGGSGVKLRRY